MAPLRLRKWAQGNKLKHRSMGIESEGIDRLLQLQTEFLVGIQASGLHNELLRQVGVDTPVPCFVGLGQSAAGHLPAKSQRIEQLASGAQAGLDVPQTLPVRQLRKCHCQKLVPAREAAHPAVSSITLDNAGTVPGESPPLAGQKPFVLDSCPETGLYLLTVWVWA